ncbi:hypothetical protein [Stakelama tenebrarum]|uniref:Uncharacterized protein n=1 Tax=Stakelama tenebrarum TaxID=2711215 RepID=A0A6G6Y2X9_9SPHN|nr:hypothetical protein [Sphingosinithalassobacter tenebrarum]QIG79304.1 hypothetical protein G5C33_05530 [Sphingosinithalassobacter tenebrarum]
MTDRNPTAEAVTEDMSVAPPDPEKDTASDPKGASKDDAGTDESISERLDRNPESRQARLDRGLDESMDASDPPATTQPVHSTQPPKSSGYDPEAEKAKK